MSVNTLCKLDGYARNKRYQVKCNPIGTSAIEVGFDYSYNTQKPEARHLKQLTTTHLRSTDFLHSAKQTIICPGLYDEIHGLLTKCQKCFHSPNPIESNHQVNS